MIEFLKRFEMLDCKDIDKTMASNLNLWCNPTLEIVGVTVYRKKICSLIYLTNTRSDNYFAVNNLIQYMVELRYVHIAEETHVIR